MQRLTLRFWLASLVLLSASRLALMAWHIDRVAAADAWWPILAGGLRFDIVALCMLSLPVALLAPWLGHSLLANRLTAYWYRACWLLLAFLEIITPTFIQEYDTRPNRLLVEYLAYPREVAGMLWQGFGSTLLFVSLAITVATAVALWCFRPGTPEPRRGWAWRTSLSVILLLLMTIGIRGTLQHRPINPATVAFSSDAMLNTLPLNSFYLASYAIYRMKDERSASALYGSMPADEIVAIVRQDAGMPPRSDDRLPPTWHRQSAPEGRNDRPYTSQYRPYRGRKPGSAVCRPLGRPTAHTRTRCLGRQRLDLHSGVCHRYPLSPRPGSNRRRLSPTPAEAVLKLPKAQEGFFTLARLLGRHGYRSRFVYGGEAHFDNMSAFFLANGFDEVIDRKKFVDPQFVGSWGASDEDMFRQVDRLLREPTDRPTFTLAFSVSHHTPWDYPTGRIQAVGEAATQDNAIRYVDRTLGDFFRRAREASYWKDTLFVVIADHDSRVGGASLVPVSNFHIPAMILGEGIEPRRDPRLTSQIDLAPTLLGLLGLDTQHPMIGRDLNAPAAGGRRPAAGGRAMLQYGDNFGWLTPKYLLVLEPGGKSTQLRREIDGTFTPVATDPDLARIALAHALWPELAYRERQYRMVDSGTATGMGHVTR